MLLIGSLSVNQLAKVKGYAKHRNGKAHPIHEKNGITEDQLNVSVKGNNDTIKVEKKKPDPRYKQVQIYKFDELSDKSKERALERGRESAAEFFSVDNFDPYYLFGLEGLKFKKVYYDLDRGQFIQFPDLEVTNKEEFRKALGISKKLFDKIDYKFVDDGREGNTKIEFFDPQTYDEIEEGHGYNHENLSKSELHEIDDAREKFDDLIHKAWVSLRDAYEYDLSDEAVIDNIKSNDYDFEENGDIA